jgi:hypothetical protein
MIQLPPDAMSQIFSNAPLLDASVSKLDVLTKAGINQTRNRLAYFR